MPFGSGLSFPVMLRMILTAELIPVNIAEIRTENLPVINLFRRKRLVKSRYSDSKQAETRSLNSCIAFSDSTFRAPEMKSFAGREM